MPKWRIATCDRPGCNAIVTALQKLQFKNNTVSYSRNNLRQLNNCIMKVSVQLWLVAHLYYYYIELARFLLRRLIDSYATHNRYYPESLCLFLIDQLRSNNANKQYDYIH